MGTIGEWTGVLLIGLFWGIFFAAKIPFSRESENAKSSHSLWLGCALSALTMSIWILFGRRALHSPLISIFIPVLAGGLLLYSIPASKASYSSTRLWVSRWVLGGLGIAMLLAFEKRAFQSPIVFITIPSVAAAGLIEWVSRSKTKRA